MFLHSDILELKENHIMKSLISRLARPESRMVFLTLGLSVFFIFLALVIYLMNLPTP